MGKHGTRDPARFITGEEKRSPCDIPSCAFCSQWTGSAAQRAHIIVYMADECPVDMSGCETIHTDIVTSVMHRHDTCELRYAGFCDRVGNIGGEASSQAINRRNVNDGAASAGYHQGQGMLAGEHHAFQVDGKNLVKLFIIDFSDHTQSISRHVVKKNMQAPVSLLAGGNHSPDIVFLGHIRLRDGGDCHPLA